MDNNIRDFVGRRIRSLRMRKSMTQEKLAEMSGLHPTYVGQIERGEKNATIESINRIATALEMSMQEFFQNAEKAPTPPHEPLFELYDQLTRLDTKDQEEICAIVKRILSFRRK